MSVRLLGVAVRGLYTNGLRGTRGGAAFVVGTLGGEDLCTLQQHFQVNNGVLYYLDYIEDIYIRALSVLVSTLDP